MFAYCQNNPVMYSDPSGNFAIGAILGALSGAGQISSSSSTSDYSDELNVIDFNAEKWREMIDKELQEFVTGYIPDSLEILNEPIHRKGMPGINEIIEGISTIASEVLPGWMVSSVMILIPDFPSSDYDSFSIKAEFDWGIEYGTFEYYEDGKHRLILTGIVFEK